MKISVIVPVLNEARTLPILLEQLHGLPKATCEVIFVDGGSQDGSVGMMESSGFKIIRADCGRAQQMNLGAARACGDIFLFLHADTSLPAEACDAIIRAVSQGGYCWGRFNVRILGSSRILPLVAFLMNWRSRLTGIATGDQAIFVKSSTFHAINGFPHQPLMEDIEISKRLKRIARPACLTKKVLTSGRRWESRGVWRTIFLMWYLRLSYWLGTPAHKLARKYK